MSRKLSLLLVLILVFFMATSNISTSASKKLPAGYSVIKISSVKWGQEPGGTKGCQGCSAWGAPVMATVVFVAAPPTNILLASILLLRQIVRV
jgi:hypothetical protein